MRKLLSLLALTAAMFFTANNESQAQAYQKGDKLLNAGISSGGYGWYSSGFGVGASYEQGISEWISVGAQADFRFYDYGLNISGVKDSYVALPIAARGSYHFGNHFLRVEALDLYGGAQLGFNIDNNEWKTGSDVVIGIHAGARYYFKPAFGVFAELASGTNVFPVKAGLTFKF